MRTEIWFWMIFKVNANFREFKARVIAVTETRVKS